MKNSIKYYLLPFLLVSFGCEDNPASDKLVEQVVDQFTGTSDDAIQELNKLKQYEYKVLEYPLDRSQAQIELELNALGKESWDCFGSERVLSTDQKPTLLVFCKRRPDTPLRFVPNSVLGR
jgi:hypothetical protein